MYMFNICLNYIRTSLLLWIVCSAIKKIKAHSIFITQTISSNRRINFHLAFEGNRFQLKTSWRIHAWNGNDGYGGNSWGSQTKTRKKSIARCIDC